TAPVFTTTPPQLSLPYGGHIGSSEGPLPYGDGTGHGGTPHPPRYYKLDFPTYDGAVDPLNWLNHCEQFFCGQRTPASDRTWLASYHLTGGAQTWYYALVPRHAPLRAGSPALRLHGAGLRRALQRRPVPCAG